MKTNRYQSILWAMSIASLAVCFVLTVSCAPKPSMRGLQHLESKYETKLRQWTMSDQVYNEFDKVLLVHGTYLAPDFREAFGTQYLSIFGIDPGKVDSDLEMIATSVGRGHEFFLFVDMTSFSWNNLDELDSVWRMALWGGPDQLGVPPISIHRFRGRGPNLKAFFPYLNDFGLAYFVVFPLDQPNGKPILDPKYSSLTIKMASAFGAAELNWKVKE